MSIACTGASRRNTLVRMSSSSSSSDQICASFFSKMGDLIEDYTHNFMKSVKDFKLNLESLQKSLILLNAKACDVMEQIKFPQDPGQKKRKREIEEWLRQVKSIENEVAELGTQAESGGFIKNLIDGGKLVQLNEEIVKLVEQSEHFDELLLGACGTKGVELLTTRMVGEAFEENLERIWSHLKTREVCSIGIYGMGGVGKTALAKCINNRLLQQSQVRVFWINVSLEFTVKSLQDKIAYFLGLNLSDVDDEDIRAARIHRALSRMKNSVIIVDDLWKYVDLLKVGCPGFGGCCALIITTRFLEVCHQFRCQKVIRVEKLCEGEAWKLFIETFTPGEELELNPHVEETAKSVARFCDGLPLGIITLAGRMRGKTSIHSWTTALTKLMDGDVEVFRILKYSFDRLNSQSHSKEFNLFQRCFLYCSLYPQSFLPNRNELVERFITEGLVDGGKSRRAQVHQGHAILDNLVDVCLLETDGNECMKMHELVRGMALKICKGKYMIRGGDYTLKEIPHEHEWTKDLEKVCLMHNAIRFIRDGTSPHCPKLSSLLLQDNPLMDIPDSFFCQMKQLSTLDLCRTDIKMLPDFVSDLTSLEALLCEGCSMLNTVPNLGKLKALRELNLSHTAIREVPHGVEQLLNLKSLSMDAPRLKMLPGGFLFKLVHLQILKFSVQVEIPPEDFQYLKEVEQLYGRLNNVHAFNCFIRRRRHGHDAPYRVQVGLFNHSDGINVFGDHDRELYLSECDLEDVKLLGWDVQALVIRECEGLTSCLLDNISRSSYPMSLKLLTVKKCGDIECILTSSPDLPSQSSTLEQMDLEDLEYFDGLIKEGDMGAAPSVPVFSSLRILTIENCNRMRKLGLPILGAPNLEDITISNCGAIEEIFEDEGRGCVVRPKLRELSLSQLPTLKSVCKAKLVCNSIKIISISKCPRLIKKLPLHMDVDVPSAPTLAEIYVEREWWESLVWNNPDLPLLLNPLVKFF